MPRTVKDARRSFVGIVTCMGWPAGWLSSDTPRLLGDTATVRGDNGATGRRTKACTGTSSRKLRGFGLPLRGGGTNVWEPLLMRNKSPGASVPSALTESLCRKYPLLTVVPGNGPGEVIGVPPPRAVPAQCWSLLGRVRV